METTGLQNLDQATHLSEAEKQELLLLISDVLEQINTIKANPHLSDKERNKEVIE